MIHDGVARKFVLVDRSVSFDPAKLICSGWNIEEEDERSLNFTEVDLSVIRLEHMLKSEHSITGEEKLRRLKVARHIRLDARIFQTLWENKHLIPENWKEKVNGNTQYIFFDGTILRRSKDGLRGAWCLCFKDDQWYRSLNWLGFHWLAHGPSAVLA